MDFDAFEKELAKRTEESFASKDDSGKFRGIFKNVSELKLFKPGEGEHIIDIVPYFCGENDPKSPKNSPRYFLDVWVHYNIGSTEDSYVCPARTFADKQNPNHIDNRCPICEYQASLKSQDDYDEELVKTLNPKRRTIYNILCYDTKNEEDKGLQVWDVAHWHLEKHLSVLSKAKGIRSGAATGGVITFSAPKTGKSIVFTKKGKAPNIEFIGHGFEDRIKGDEPYIITEEQLAKAKVLDEIVTFSNYDTIYKAFYGKALGEERTRVKQKETAPKEIEEEDIPSEAEEVAADTTSAKRTPRQSQEQEGQKCPEGGNFGVDTEELKGCTACEEEIWLACSKKKKESEAKPQEGRRVKR